MTDSWMVTPLPCSSEVTLSQTTMALLWQLCRPACYSMEVRRSAGGVACRWDVSDKEGTLKLYFGDFMWLSLPSRVAWHLQTSCTFSLKRNPFMLNQTVFLEQIWRPCALCDACWWIFKLLIRRGPTAVCTYVSARFNTQYPDVFFNL